MKKRSNKEDVSEEERTIISEKTIRTMECKDDEEIWAQKTKDSEKATTAIISRKINEKKTGKDLKNGC